MSLLTCYVTQKAFGLSEYLATCQPATSLTIGLLGPVDDYWVAHVVIRPLITLPVRPLVHFLHYLIAYNS
jgi:hypothetical protein